MDVHNFFFFSGLPYKNNFSEIYYELECFQHFKTKKK